EALAVLEAQRVRDDVVVHEVDDQLDHALQAAGHELGPRGDHAHRDEHDGQDDESHQLDAVELEPRAVEEDRVREELTQRGDVEEGVALCVQCRTEVCGVQLDLPGSFDRRGRPGWSCQIELTRGAATVRTAMDDAMAFPGGRSALFSLNVPGHHYGP